MSDRKQVNVDRLSPAFFWKISPTCSVLSRDGLESGNRSRLQGETGDCVT